MNARGFDGFFERHGRQDGGNALGEHSFTGAGRADEENVVTAGTGDFQRTFCGLLAVNFAEVDIVFRGFAEKELRIDLNRRERFGSVDEVDGLGKRFYRANFDAGDDSGFARVGFGNSECEEAAFARGERGG